MDETISKRYGATGVWITDTATYSDGLDVVKLNDKRIGTLVATFIGELKDAISAAPPLNSLSALLDPDMRLHSRQFQKNGDSVTATFTYGVFEDETPSYTMNAQPKKISLLSSSRFAKISDVERVLAQAYLNGMTDATTVWRNKKGTSAEIAESVPAEERKNWERTTLGSLVSRYASGSTVVRLARKGVKSLNADSITWTETKTTRSADVPSRLGERSSPRGNNPSGHKWIMKSVESKQTANDTDGNPRFTTTTVWETDDDDSEGKDS